MAKTSHLENTSVPAWCLNCCSKLLPQLLKYTVYEDWTCYLFMGNIIQKYDQQKMRMIIMFLRKLEQETSVSLENLVIEIESNYFLSYNYATSCWYIWKISTSNSKYILRYILSYYLMSFLCSERKKNRKQTVWCIQITFNPLNPQQ